MSDSPQHNFADRDLRNRSFQGQILNGADFSGADIRGCNFSNAQLVGANFERVKTGLSRRQLISILLTIAIVFFLLGDVLGRLIFNAQGEVPGSHSWSFVILLYTVLMVAGLAAGITAICGKTYALGRVAIAVSSILSGAIVGFFYLGVLSNNNPILALAGMLAGGSLMYFVNSQWHSQLAKIAIAAAAAAAITAYGATFLLSATASSFLSVEIIFPWGVVFTLLSLVYFWLALVSFFHVVFQVQQAVGTSFKKANLTDAIFTKAELRNTDIDR